MSVLEYTPLDEIPIRVQKLKESFHSRKFDPVEVRLRNLRKLYYAIEDNQDVLCQAVEKDLNKPVNETRVLEINIILGDLLFIMENLKSWAKDRRPEAVPLMYKFSGSRVESIPLGTVLVIGTFNYPLSLALQPVIGAIAAGNTVVLKQSEQSPHVSAVLSEILADQMDNELVQCINGGVEETGVLLDQKFDKVFYTGSGTVGKIIAKKCAESLTPCILELGGKSPAFVTAQSKNLDLAAKRIVNAKFVNAGQTCVTVDYCLVEESIYSEFTEYLVKWTKKLYGDANADNYTKIVNGRNVKRILSLLDSTKATVLYSGEHNADERFIHPTLLENVEWHDSTMTDELFAPILPLLKYKSLESAIESVIKNHDTPLALYAFTDSKNESKLIQQRIRSGGFMQNDAVMHVGMPQLPFGGIGTSGYGQYHGHDSFRAFSHERAIIKQPWWTEILLDARYRPISNFDATLARFATVPFKTFARTGKIVSFKSAAFKAVIGIVAMYGLYVGFTSDRDAKLINISF